MKSRSDVPSKDELCYVVLALTQRSDYLLQFLVHISLKEKALCMRKGHAFNHKIKMVHLLRIFSQTLLWKIKGRSTHYETINT